jgi:hypothetical protein
MHFIACLRKQALLTHVIVLQRPSAAAAGAAHHPSTDAGRHGRIPKGAEALARAIAASRPGSPSLPADVEASPKQRSPRRNQVPWSLHSIAVCRNALSLA